jgi:hypothetical protein
MGVAAPAMATFPGANGEISYAAGGIAIGGSGAFEDFTNLFVSAPDGSGVRPLTTGQRQDIGGQWSPDGSQLVFSRPFSPGTGGGYTRETLLVSADGGPAQDVLVNDCAECSFGSWTPDGTRFVASRQSPGPLGVYSMRPDGSDAHLLVATGTGQPLQPVISPDGTKVAYTLEVTGYAEPSLVVVANVDGTNVHAISYGMSPDWSPDSSRLAYATDNPDDKGPRWPQWVMVANADGGGRVPVAATDLWEDSPSWSPDGSEIVFVANVRYVLAARAPVGLVGQPPGADSLGCVRGYRAVVTGVVLETHWGSHHPASGAAAHPATLPCGAAAPDANTPKALLSTTLARHPGRLSGRVRLAKGAKGKLVVKATLHHRALKRRGHAGNRTRRSYRFTVNRTGTAVVTVRFIGKKGWASAHPRSKHIHVRPKR